MGCGLSTSATPAATFKHHTAPISSVEWHPDDGTVFASAGSDDQVSPFLILHTHTHKLQGKFETRLCHKLRRIGEDSVT